MEGLLISAFVTGLLGSLHCLGMCGPLQMAVPRAAKPWLGETLYQGARIATYGLLGLVLGSAGQSLTWAFSQQGVSLVAGGVLLMLALLPYSSRWKVLSPLNRVYQALRGRYLSRIPRQSYAFQAFLGALNGVLPCGLVYIPLAGAVASAQAGYGAAVMIAFGLGTLPALLALKGGLSLFQSRWLPRSTRWGTTAALTVSLLLMVRGLNLGIPYLSPKVKAPQQSSIKAHTDRPIMDCCRRPQ